MKLANHTGRAALVFDDQIADIATESEGRFGPDPMALFHEWGAFCEFASAVTAGNRPLVTAELRNPVPRPKQVFGIGINYRTPRGGVRNGVARRADRVHEVPGEPDRPVRRHRGRG